VRQPNSGWGGRISDGHRSKCDWLKQLTRPTLLEQRVATAAIIHVRDGESKRRTNKVILTFAFPQPPRHTTAGYLRVPVDPYIPNPLHCFNCQKYCHRSRACKNSATCVKCGAMMEPAAAINNVNC